MSAQLTGSVFSLLTAILLALGMNIQRYSLTPSSLEDDGRIEVLGCCRMRKNALWLLGLVVYGSSNVPYMVGLSFAPLSLMTAVFASVVLFNAVFSVIINHETLTRVKLLGCGMIVAGVALCGIFAPSEMTQYTAPQIWDLVRKWGAIVYIVALVLFQLCMWLTVRRFDQQFPGYWKRKRMTIDPTAEDTRFSVLKVGLDGDKLRAEIEKVVSRRAQQRHQDSGEFAVGKGTLRSGRASITYRRPTSWQATMALFAHTSVLAIFESYVQLWLKALSTIGWRILEGHDDWRHKIFWIAIGCLLLCAIGVIYWLRKVYSRFEVTEGLPIEYGLVTVLGLIGGLLFYEEVYQIDELQSAMLIVGLGFIVAGIVAPSFISAGPPGSTDEALRPKLRGRLRTESMSPRSLHHMQKQAQQADHDAAANELGALEAVREDDERQSSISQAELDAAAAVSAANAEERVAPHGIQAVVATADPVIKGTAAEV